MFLSLVLLAAASIIYVLLGGQAMEIRPRKTVTAAPARPAPSSDVTERDRLLDNLQSQGVIVKRTCIGNEAQVNPLGWQALNVDAQRTVARALAAWCESQGRGRQMTIIDEQSGRPLAEVAYGEYRVY